MDETKNVSINIICRLIGNLSRLFISQITFECTAVWIFFRKLKKGINVILKKGKPGNLYWISSGKKTWFYDLAKSLRKSTNCKINFISSPTYTKKVDVGNFIVNNSKLKSLGWKPKISLEEGIKKTLNSF